MKKTIILLSLLLLLIAGVASANTLATLYSPVSGHKQVVYLNDKAGINNLFNLGYELYTNKEDQKLGIALPNLVAVFQTSLATKLTSTATTSMTLVSGTTADGTTLSGSYAFIIDEGSSNQEFVTATCTATACTDLTRGISVVDGKTSVTALKKAHGRGASVKITNYPQLTLLTNIFKGTETVQAVMSYDDSIVTSSFTGLKNLVSKQYVDNIAFISGSPDSTISTKGIGKISSAPSVASSPIFLNSEEVATTTGNDKVVRANGSGKINQNWLDLTEDFAFSGTNSYSGTLNVSATTTFSALTKVATSTPTVAGQVVGLDSTSKLPAIDGSQLLGVLDQAKAFVDTIDLSAANATTTYAHGLGYTPKSVILHAIFENGATDINVNGFYGNGTQVSTYSGSIGYGYRGGDSATAIFYVNTGSGVKTGTITALDSTNITITWVVSDAPDDIIMRLLFIVGK